MLRIKRITPLLGAEIALQDVDLTSESGAEQLLRALDTYGVLVFPQCYASDEQMVQMSNAIGEMEAAKVTADHSDASQMGIYRISKGDKNEAQSEYVKGNDYWHMDGTSYSVPGKATLLKCENPPSEGGETEFANLFAAFDALDDQKKELLKELRAFHSMAAALRYVNTEPSDEDRARWHRIFPPTLQPLVWEQPDGRFTMIIGTSAESVQGMEADAGRALLDELLAWSTSPRFTYLHKWKRGDLVIFNNPGLLHRSRPYPETAGRVLHRATVKGSLSTQ